MPTRTGSNISTDDRLSSISNRLIVMSLNIHIELTDGHFSLSRSNKIRKHSDLSLIGSSTSNSLIDELLACVEYYSHQVIELADELRLITIKNSIQIVDDLSRGSQLCLDVLQSYSSDRSEAVRSILTNPFREDAWYIVYEIDWNIFRKCRIILIRLRTYFLLMHQLLPDTFHSLVNSKKKANQNNIRKF